MTDPDAAPSGSSKASLRVFDAWTIRQAMTARLALVSAEHAFKALARGKAVVPPPLAAEFKDVNGEVHVKGAYLEGSPVFVFKVATGFYNNVQFGVPTGSGMVLVFDAETGFPRCVLADNGYLTDLRTAAAGALAARYLAPEKPLRVGMVGAGVQARLQLRLLTAVRPVAEARVWSRSAPSRQHYAERMHSELLVPIRPVDTVSEAVESADVVITATPSRTPLVQPGHLSPGATVIAVGSDGHGKQELAAEILATADKVVVDLTTQAVTLGEVHHAVRGGHLTLESIYGELGEIVTGDKPGRDRDDEVIICDLTGVGAQDAAIAEMAYRILAKNESAIADDP